MPAPWPEEKVQAVIEFYQNGENLGTCARAFRTNRNVVRKYLLRHGVRIRPHIEVAPRGDRHHAWKGGRHVGEYIYLPAPDHPHKNWSGHVLEHRLVMEKHLGRYLLPTEVVHHKDKNKHNNAIENLEVFSTNAEHLAAELKGQTPKWTEDGKRRIAEGVQRAAKRNRKKNRSKSGDHPSL